MDTVGYSNNQPPEISDQNQKYENQYFSMLYPKGWNVKEIYGPDMAGSTSDGMVQEAMQNYGPKILERIYFLDPQYADYVVLVVIIAADEHTKEVINITGETDTKGFEKEYRDTKFDKFSTSSNEIFLGGIKGLKQIYMATDDSGQQETENMILLSTSNFIYQIQYKEKSNFNSKTIQRIEDITNSFSLSATTEGSNPNDAKAYNDRGFMEYKQGNSNQALADFNKAIELNPNYAEAYGARASIYVDQNNLSDALSDINKSIELNSNLYWTYVLRAAVYQQQGNFTQQLNDLNRAIELKPDDAKPYNTRGLLFEQQSNFTQALADFNKAIELNPNFSDAYSNRGAIYDQQSNFTQALADFNKAIELNPNEEQIYYNRGQMYQDQGNFIQALDDYNKAIELNPNMAGAYINRGYIYDKQGNFTQALFDYNKSIELYPNAVVYCYRGQMYQDQNNLTQALADYNKAIELNPNLGLGYNLRAKVYFYYSREFDNAWADVHKAQSLGVTIDPQFINDLKKTTRRDQ